MLNTKILKSVEMELVAEVIPKEMTKKWCGMKDEFNEI